ncbi:alpha/beta fold hydrolase [Nocardia sp. GTS18]|uniref:alpha/beta fold hydrolase n=1 Tax=Nocardia sp. GTS18 TaxID=1778064 RepID=UPI0015EEBF2C|nr:hypothetical protein [Nocardia sp. GTS18]
MTDGVVQFLDAARIDRASFVAHSMNGALAVDLAARYPERVDRMGERDTWVPVRQVGEVATRHPLTRS